MKAQARAGLDVEGLSPVDQEQNEADRSPFSNLVIHEVKQTECELYIHDRLATRTDFLVVFYQVNNVIKKLTRTISMSGNHYMFSSGGLLHYRGFTHYIKKFIYLNILSLNVVRHASAFHFITSFEMKRASLLLPFYKSKFIMIPNVVDADVQTSDVAECMDPSRPFTFVFLGRIDPLGKGLDLALEAFSLLPETYSCKLRIAGPDWQGGVGQLKTLAQQYGVSEKVEFLGPKYDEDKVRFLQSGDAFLALSRWEAFGIAIAEAMLAGLPVLASNKLNLVPDMEQAQAAYITNLSVHDIASSMKEMIENPRLCSSLKQRGKKWVMESFSSECVGQKFQEELGKIV
jgi:glycosyltransferase involved in cell wall biosynthesis